MTPRRIQRKRTKGWRMPPATRYVGRGTYFGNPWDARIFGQENAVARFGEWMAVERLFPLAIATGPVWARPEPSQIQRDLRGKDLACWCPLSEPCHADVLLEIANGEVVTP